MAGGLWRLFSDSAVTLLQIQVTPCTTVSTSLVHPPQLLSTRPKFPSPNVLRQALSVPPSIPRGVGGWGMNDPMLNLYIYIYMYTFTCTSAGLAKRSSLTYIYVYIHVLSISISTRPTRCCGHQSVPYTERYRSARISDSRMYGTFL